MKQMNGQMLKAAIASLIFLIFTGSVCKPSQAQGRVNDAPATLGIDGGFTDHHTPTINLKLVKASGTVAGLETTESNFDYTPSDRLENRAANGYYHLGDVNLRLKKDGENEWKDYSTARERQPVEVLNTDNENVLSAANLANTLPDDFPLELERFWQKEGDHLALKFALTNNTDTPIEIGALGIPLIFNNNIDRKSLDEAHTENVFFDPYIGGDAGYLQVARLNGEDEVLLVLPWKKSPFEAYRPLLDDPTRRGITFEGFHEWMIHSKAYADNEWKESEQWNEPTSKILAPGESYEVGLEFVLAPGIRSIEETLLQHQRPVAVGVPGYILPMDVDGKLFIKHHSEVKSISVEPSGALKVRAVNTTPNAWTEYAVSAKKWGRARVDIEYTDGKKQSINYKVIKPESEVVADNGNFLTTEQWYENDDDLFGRSPSVITYDYDVKRKVLEDSRAWICGLSDEGGAGAWLNAVMKQFVQPNPDQVEQLERFVNNTLWGGIQYSEGENKYGVRKSMFYYEPDSVPAGTYSDSINYNTWAAWSKKDAESVVRSYNYPHVAAAHWVMYRLGRNYNGLVKQRSWQWYLEHACHTAMAMVEQAPHYAQFGQMEGSIFLLVLNDLKAEGMDEMAKQLETAMKVRASHWASLNYPFGSEMPWDSTGQEEVYMWSRYFGFDQKALVTLNAILAYMPTVPHWAYNGNARRYWDFLYGGKYSRIERMIHHYGSALNAIPVLHEYKLQPDDFYLLRVGYGGMMGALSNITQDGFAPCASHSFPSSLWNDGISGDYGPGYFGYAVNSSSYLIKHDEFGWLSFGANSSEKKGLVRMEITSASKSRVFIAPEKLWLTLDAGSIRSLSYNPQNGEVQVTLEKGNSFTPKAFVHVENFGSDATNFEVKNLTINERGAYEAELDDKPVTFTITRK
ncbi:DUF5695 domain-containing protein [Roseimarinus sediminis]|uniref:DUF5695 domain-containing protein n=1 Tax=Roseimarinus sediminis TaxID=1610899 RepID=UPI003D19A96F